MKNIIICFLMLILTVFFSGCVERELTINTDPQGGLVYLNDEEIGTAPVTVGFQWYGDYAVQISKQGYQTLNTHKKLNKPWYDHFPFDFFVECLWFGDIVDNYQWDFKLEPYQQPKREHLMESAEYLRKETEYELK